MAKEQPIEPDDVATNRDLYCFVAQLIRGEKESGLTLQQYLENLLVLASPLQHVESVAANQLAGLLKDAFHGPCDGIRAPIELTASADEPTTGFAEWRDTLVRQLRDLREMADEGTLEDPYRYFGIDAPRGARWYNFDPCTYLECGVAGALGGWEEGDDTGRAYVPGKVAVLDGDGNLHSCDPRELKTEVTSIDRLTWEELVDFLECGQMYE